MEPMLVVYLLTLTGISVVAFLMGLKIGRIIEKKRKQEK